MMLIFNNKKRGLNSPHLLLEVLRKPKDEDVRENSSRYSMNHLRYPSHLLNISQVPNNEC